MQSHAVVWTSTDKVNVDKIDTVTRWSLPLLLVLLALCCGPVKAQWRGSVDVEYRHFLYDPLDARQSSDYVSMSAEPEFVHSWNDGRDLFSFRPFLRYDHRDQKRSHVDLRELTWTHAADDWELKVGVGKVYWGVTESAHLVDVINQTDFVENSDGEDKLGQPMLNLTLIRDWGNLDFFLLPGFRERTFPSAAGRPGGRPVVDPDLVEYESAAEDGRLDAALRWSHTLGDYDVGVSHFHGTRREPRFEARTGGQASASDAVVLAPIYDVVSQTGIDLQATFDSILWKVEIMRQSGLRDPVTPSSNRWWAAALGFEYTFFGAFDSDMDVGLLMEYLHDSRGVRSSAFENDVFFGARLAINDTQGTEMLIGGIVDVDGDGRTFNLEASRRIGDDWRLYIEARAISGSSQQSLLSSLREDDYVQVTLGYFF